MSNQKRETTKAASLFQQALDCHRVGDLRTAATLYKEVLSLGGPEMVDAHINLGVILDANAHYEDAVFHYRVALDLSPGNPVALNNMGNSQMKLGRFKEAADCFHSVIESGSNIKEACNAYGSALQKGGDIEGAIAWCQKMLEDNPACAEAHWNLALALLKAGDFHTGWAEYEWRWRRDSFSSPQRDFQQPQWDGSPLEGKRILIHAEQGLGDTFQFLRYVPLVAQAGGQVLLEGQASSLRPVLETVEGVHEVFVMGDPLPPFDVHIPLISLPHIFGTTLENVPGQRPYLEAHPLRRVFWRHKVTFHTKEEAPLKVGVVWAGKAVPDPFRSSTIQDVAPLFSIPGVTFFSLQLDHKPLPPELGVVDLTSDIRHFGDTAALLSLLDLVVSVDTSVAHLAGALGKPVFLMLPEAADWRWMLEREDSPWYPSMRLFRQKEQGEWSEVVQRVHSAITTMVSPQQQELTSFTELNGEGLRLASEGKHAKAIQVYARALEVGGEHPVLHYNMGNSLHAIGDNNEAIDRFCRAVALDSEMVEGWYNLSLVLFTEGKTAEAKEALKETLTRNPHFLDGIKFLGEIHLAAGDIDKALVCFEKVLDQDSLHFDAWNSKGVALHKQKRMVEAIFCYQKTVEIRPDHIEAMHNLRIVNLTLGLKDVAASWLHRILSVDPGYTI